ncbi:ferric siderophore transport system periplasmic binding protein TonB [Photobacterium aphoticum]|uniref:Ferric siderophore transport system periplasmic binding protein TonB n=1 Tax=Photobacterium aphoticum TaxID=754436 RepID=A0A090QK00_9GAMM|nr:ferric siderophore transport system periplasmic binding protein TonB [Photobacterium aphoticum]
MRLLVALPIALAMALGLFTFMAWMVDNGHQRAEKEKTIVAIDMVMVEQEREARRRQRAVPEKPDTPEPPPQAMPTASTQAVTNTVAPSMPSLNLDTAVSGLAINMRHSPILVLISKPCRCIVLNRVILPAR